MLERTYIASNLVFFLSAFELVASGVLSSVLERTKMFELKAISNVLCLLFLIFMIFV